MMAGTDGDAFMIKNCADIMGMHPVHHEGQDAGLVVCRTDETHTRDIQYAGGGVA